MFNFRGQSVLTTTYYLAIALPIFNRVIKVIY